MSEPTWVETMTALLNHRVEVTLRELPNETVTGTLVAFDLYGHVEIRTDDGTMRYAWPSLKIKEL